MGGSSCGQQDSTGKLPSPSLHLCRGGAADSCHQPTWRVSNFITVSDLPLGKRPQVKPLISAASLAWAVRALNILCLPQGTAAAVNSHWTSP